MNSWLNTSNIEELRHTLKSYFLKVAYQAMAKYLVKVKGYSEKLLNPVKEHASLW